MEGLLNYDPKQTMGYKAIRNNIPELLHSYPNMEATMDLFGMATEGVGLGEKYKIHPDTIRQLFSSLDKVQKIRRPDNMGPHVQSLIMKALSKIDHPDDPHYLSQNLSPQEEMAVINRGLLD